MAGASRKVLAPVDDVELARGVLGALRGVLDPGSCWVRLVAVVDPRRRCAREEGLELGSLESRREVAERSLEGLGEWLEGEGYEVGREVWVGDPAEQILAEVERVRPWLVVMGSHGRVGVSRWVRGSVAERVLRRSPVPVLLTTPGAGGAGGSGRLRRVLVPLDGSRRSETVLDAVEGLRGEGLEVTLLRVGVGFVPVGSTLAAGEAMALDGPPEPEAQQALEESMERAEARLKAAGVRVTRRVEPSADIAGTILEVAEEHDLVALTTHGWSGVDRWLFGSVAETVLRHCARPVLVKRVMTAPTT